MKTKKKANQEKALTKAELVKLYEEFKEKKKEELKKARQEHDLKKCVLKDFTQGLEKHYKGIGILKPTLMVSEKDVFKVVLEILGDYPTYREPTFNEFMESLGEKPEFVFYEIGSTKYSYDPQEERVILTSN